MTVNGLLSVTSTACDNLQNAGYTPSGNANRLAQEMLKNRIDAINNNGDGRAGHTVSGLVPESAGAVPIITEVKR